MNCYKCGRIGHRDFECKSKEIVCYNCGEAGHISTKCTNPKREKAGGKVFALNVEEGPEPDNLIVGIYFINITPLLDIIDMGVTHSFISLGCDERSNLVMSPLSRGWSLIPPANGSVTTSLVCVKCPVNFGNVNFELNLVCLPLEHMKVIFGMDWMLSFGVSINC